MVLMMKRRNGEAMGIPFCGHRVNCRVNAQLDPAQAKGTNFGAEDVPSGLSTLFFYYCDKIP